MAKTKTTMSDLNEMLFEQMERLTNDDLTDEELEKELKRSKGVTSIATTIIENSALAISARKVLDEYGQGDSVEIPLLGITNK